MPFNEICKLEVVNFLYIFDQCQESYLLTDIALLSCEDYIYLLTPQSYSSWVIDGESQCSLDFPNCQSVAQFPHLPEGKNNLKKFLKSCPILSLPIQSIWKAN